MAASHIRDMDRRCYHDDTKSGASPLGDMMEEIVKLSRDFLQESEDLLVNNGSRIIHLSLTRSRLQPSTFLTS